MKKFVLGLASMFAAMSLLVATPALVTAQDTGDVCEGIGLTGGNCDDTTGAQSGIQNVVTTVVNILSLVVGAVAVIMIIIGGLRYIISGGDSGSVQSAKNTILYALVGLVVVIFARAIVIFIVNRLSPAASGGGATGTGG